MRWLKARAGGAEPARGADWLRTEPWRDATIPADVQDVPTMLSVEERRLLYVLARDYVLGDRTIVDAGCFLGGSTMALASGLDENPRAADARSIHSYDLFQLDGAYKHGYPGLVEGIEVGGSMRPRFEELLGTRLDRVNVHEGDICGQRWGGDPIDVLFIDLCKSWDINDYMVKEFFPKLTPGRSVVIQQDLIHEWLPYLTMTMGFFSEAFELIGVAPPCSAIYLHTRPISPEDVPARLDALSDARKLELFDRGCAPFSGEDRAVIECSRAVLLVNLGRPQEAASHLAATAAAYPDSERIDFIRREVGRWLEPHLSQEQT